MRGGQAEISTGTPSCCRQARCLRILSLASMLKTPTTLPTTGVFEGPTVDDIDAWIPEACQADAMGSSGDPGSIRTRDPGFGGR